MWLSSRERRRTRWRRSSRTRGAVQVEYLVVLALLGLVVATALATVAAPELYKTFRRVQRNAAAPMP